MKGNTESKDKLINATRRMSDSRSAGQAIGIYELSSPLERAREKLKGGTATAKDLAVIINAVGSVEDLEDMAAAVWIPRDDRADTRMYLSALLVHVDKAWSWMKGRYILDVLVKSLDPNQPNAKHINIKSLANKISVSFTTLSHQGERDFKEYISAVFEVYESSRNIEAVRDLISVTSQNPYLTALVSMEFDKRIRPEDKVVLLRLMSDCENVNMYWAGVICEALQQDDLSYDDEDFILRAILRMDTHTATASKLVDEWLRDEEKRALHCDILLRICLKSKQYELVESVFLDAGNLSLEQREALATFVLGMVRSDHDEHERIVKEIQAF